MANNVEASVSIIFYLISYSLFTEKRMLKKIEKAIVLKYPRVPGAPSYC